MLPEIGNAESAVRALEGGKKAVGVVEIRGHDLRTEFAQRARLFRTGVARQGTNGKTAVRVGQCGTSQAPALCPGCADDGNGPFPSH